MIFYLIMKYLISTIAVMSVFIPVHGQQAEKDSIIISGVNTKEVKNRNVMLNASDASKPREVNIGLPASVGGTEIYEDGLPVSYYFWPHLPFKSWRGGNAYGSSKLLSLNESALLTGNVGYTLYSETRLGKDKLGTYLDYTLNHFGSQKFDFDMAGKISKDWYFSIGAFQNFDVSTNNLKFMKYQDLTQIYKAAITHRWNEDRGEISVLPSMQAV